MSDNDWLFDEEQAARIRRLVTPDETGSQDVPGPTTVLRLLDALNAAEARAEASVREAAVYRDALQDIQRYVDSGVGHGMSTNGLEYVLRDIDRRATAALSAGSGAREEAES